jgi:hypothetical protein
MSTKAPKSVTEVTRPADLALAKLGDQLILAPAARLLGGDPLGEDQPVAAAVQLDDLDRDALPDHGLQARVGLFLVVGVVPHARDLRHRHEAAQPEDVDDQAAAVGLPDRRVEDRALVEQPLDVPPALLLAPALQRQQDAPLAVLAAQHQRGDLLADDWRVGARH